MRQFRWKLMDVMKRKYFLKIEFRIQILNFFKKNGYLSLLKKIYCIFLISKKNNYSSLSKFNNRCLLYGRNYNTNKQTNYSRFVFRKQIDLGFISGFSKSSW